MERSEIKPYIAKRVAKELHDGDVVNLGIGLPTMVPDYLDPSVKLTLQSENGFIGLAAVDPEDPDAAYIVNAGGQPAGIEKDGMFFDSATSFSIIRGGHVDATILGSLQVDEKGNIANWIIPGKMVPGMGGAMDLVVGAKRVIVAMEHTERCTKDLKRVYFTADSRSSGKLDRYRDGCYGGYSGRNRIKRVQPGIHC